MPSRPPRPCTHSGCPALVTDGARCAAHRRAVEQRRGSAHARGYDRGWRRVRLRVLTDEPLCRMCKAEGRVRPANEVDHIDGDSRHNARANLRPLCKSCHSRRTMRDQGPNSGRSR